MKTKRLHTEALAIYDDVVEQAYYRIVKKAKQLLSTIEQERFRCYLECTHPSDFKASILIHEIVSPLLYLRLDCDTTSGLTIRFGIEPETNSDFLNAVTALFLRKVFEYTSRRETGTNIENCVRTDWFINSCSEMYEYIELRNKHHTLNQVKYRPAVSRKKQVLSVV